MCGTSLSLRDRPVGTLMLCFFRRWKARHVIHFDFSHGASPERDVPTLTLREPPPYSVEIQRSPTAWHFPSAPDGAEWLCAPLRPHPDAPHGKRKLEATASD